MIKGSGEYNGCKIELDGGRFKVPDLEKTYDTYVQATDAIDRAEKAKTTVAKKKVAIAVISEKRKETTITGLHAGNGNLTISPKLDDWRPDFYVRVPWIEAALKERDDLLSRASRIRSVLFKFQIRSPATEGSFWQDKYAEYVASLEKDAASKLAAAGKTTLEKELAKFKD